MCVCLNVCTVHNISGACVDCSYCFSSTSVSVCTLFAYWSMSIILELNVSSACVKRSSHEFTSKLQSGVVLCGD